MLVLTYLSWLPRPSLPHYHKSPTITSIGSCGLVYYKVNFVDGRNPRVREPRNSMSNAVKERTVCTLSNSNEFAYTFQLSFVSLGPEV